MSGPASAAAYTMAVDWPDRPRDTHPDTLLWIARIEALRFEEIGPLCPACGCSARHVPETRRCQDCNARLLIDAFVRDRRKPLGRGYRCKACKRARNRVHGAERKRRQFRAILGVAS